MSRKRLFTRHCQAVAYEGVVEMVALDGDHDGCCSFCGSAVREGFPVCAACGATWTVKRSERSVLGLVMMATVAATAVATVLQGALAKMPALALLLIPAAVMGVAFLALRIGGKVKIDKAWVRRIDLPSDRDLRLAGRQPAPGGPRSADPRSALPFGRRPPLSRS